MNREDIEKITQNVVDIYRLTYKDKSEFMAVDVVDIAHMLGFKVYTYEMEDKGEGATLSYKDYEDENGLGVNYIVMDNSFEYEDARAVISDVLVSHLIECNKNGEDAPHNIVSLVGEAQNFELVLPKKEFLKRYQELSSKNHDQSSLVEDIADEFLVPEEAILRRCESLEMMAPLTEDEAYERINDSILSLIKRTYS